MSYVMLHSVNCVCNDHRAWFWKYKTRFHIEDFYQVFNSNLVVYFIYNSPSIIVSLILTYVILIKPRLILKPILICYPVKRWYHG